MLEAIGITKKYGDHLALDNVSFTLEPGCVYALLGPNGAGKSTTMNIITGYIGATSGEVFIEGKDLSREPEEAKKHIEFVTEQLAKAEGVTEELKEKDQLEWIRRMNSIANRAEEIVMKNLIQA